MKNTAQDELLRQISDAVRTCGEIILHADRSKSCIDEKAGHANFVTTYDKRVQQELQKRLLEILPEAVFVGEEEDIHASIAKGYAFIVDPIDGTTNFIKDYHVSAISVGLALDGERYMGVVYNPYLNELFTAVKGQGAYLNGVPIHVSSQPLENGVVLFGTAPYYEELKWHMTISSVRLMCAGAARQHLTFAVWQQAGRNCFLSCVSARGIWRQVL